VPIPIWRLHQESGDVASPKIIVPRFQGLIEGGAREIKPDGQFQTGAVKRQAMIVRLK